MSEQKIRTTQRGSEAELAERGRVAAAGHPGLAGEATMGAGPERGLDGEAEMEWRDDPRRGRDDGAEVKWQAERERPAAEVAGAERGRVAAAGPESEAESGVEAAERSGGWGFGLALVFAVLADQAVKWASLNGLRWRGEFFDLVLVLNTGVAFSFLDFLGPGLKFLHLALLLCLAAYLFYQRGFLRRHSIALGLILGAGSSNLADRFIHGGVVDMFFWHKYFHFAVFNVADALINLGLVLILIREFLAAKNAKKRKKNDLSLD